VRILAMGVDTTTLTGKLVINVLGERQREGIAKVKCEGKYRGRAPRPRRKRQPLQRPHYRRAPPSGASLP
jgi:DNA invertase Pin-like site-specific DNA recombinase